MAYYPGHSYFLRSIASTAVISNTTGAVSSAPAIADAVDIGYISPGNIVINDNFQNGYASGMEDALYEKRGYREIQATADIRLGSVAFVNQFCLNAGGALPYLDLFYGVSASWARAIYKAKCARLSLGFPISDSAELTASASFEGTAYAAASPVTLAYDYGEFGPALLSTDVRTFLINGTDARTNVMSLSIDIDRSVERKNGRPEFGDNVVGSRTAYELLTHHRMISGSITLHDLPTIESALFYGTATAQRWSSIVITVNDLALAQIYDVTITNPRPSARAQNAVDSNGQMNWTIPFVASAVAISESRA